MRRVPLPQTAAAAPPPPAAPAPAPAPAEADASLITRVAEVLERIRPAVQADGGDVELVRVSAEGGVDIRFHGACVGCPSSAVTLHHGIERTLREHVPQVTSVRQVN